MAGAGPARLGQTLTDRAGTPPVSCPQGRAGFASKAPQLPFGVAVLDACPLVRPAWADPPQAVVPRHSATAGGMVRTVGGLEPLGTRVVQVRWNIARRVVALEAQVAELTAAREGLLRLTAHAAGAPGSPRRPAARHEGLDDRRGRTAAMKAPPARCTGPHGGGTSEQDRVGNSRLSPPPTAQPLPALPLVPLVPLVPFSPSAPAAPWYEPPRPAVRLRRRPRRSRCAGR